MPIQTLSYATNQESQIAKCQLRTSLIRERPAVFNGRSTANVGKASQEKGGSLVAVGTPVARRPPHRPVRAALPHTVLASGSDAEACQGIRMAYTGEWEPPVRETFHPIPDQPVFMASPFQGFPPQPADLLAEGRHRGTVHGHSIVADVPSYDGPQVSPLLRNGIVHASLQFLIHFFKLRLPPRAHRFPKDRKLPLPGQPADMREPQEVECLRFSFFAAAPVFPRKPAKLQNPCLVWMEFQPAKKDNGVRSFRPVAQSISTLSVHVHLEMSPIPSVV